MSRTPPTPVVCPRCGNTVGAEQAWCLSCGAPARTRMRPTPNWRLPVATIAAIVIVVAGGTLGAFVALTTTGDEAAPAATTVAPAAPVVPAPDPQPTTATTAAATPTAAAPAATTPTAAAPAVTTPAPAATTPGATTATPGATTAP